MRFFPSFVLVVSVAGDYPDIDSMQLLQSRKDKQSHDACMKVLTGDEASVEGTFIGVNNHKVDVSVGDVAPTPGTFCVPSATLALMERSSGLSSVGDFEAAVTSKRQRRQSIFSAQSLTLLQDTKCLDGTPAGYYSDLNEDSDVWVIFLQGGGKCYDVETCGRRTASKLGSSKRWGSASRNGVMDASCDRNEDFCEANQVYIPYCSGDSHAGTRADQHEGFYVSGHLNFLAIIESLKLQYNLGSASRVLLTGVSAGGGGVLNNADFLAGMLPNVIVKAAPIAAWFFPDSTEDQDQSWMPVSFFEDFSADPRVPSGSQIVDFWSAIQDWNQQDRGNCPDWEGVKCSNTRTKASYLQTPLFISQNMWDTVNFKIYQVTTDTTLWSGDIGDWVAYYTRSVQASTRLVGESPGNGLFLSATIAHGGDVGGGEKSSAEIEGHKYFPILADWFYDLDELPHVLIDTCDPFC